MDARLHGRYLLCRGQGQCDEFRPNRRLPRAWRLQIARLAAPLVYEIGVQAVGQRNACY